MLSRAPPRAAPQVFIESSEGLAGDELERELFIVRKLMEKEKVGPAGGRAAWHARGRRSQSAGRPQFEAP